MYNGCICSCVCVCLCLYPWLPYPSWKLALVWKFSISLLNRSSWLSPISSPFATDSLIWTHSLMSVLIAAKLYWSTTAEPFHSHLHVRICHTAVTGYKPHPSPPSPLHSIHICALDLPLESNTHYPSNRYHDTCIFLSHHTLTWQYHNYAQIMLIAEWLENMPLPLACTYASMYALLTVISTPHD